MVHLPHNFVCLVSSLRFFSFYMLKCRNPRGFGFVQFMDPADAADAKHHMDGYLLLGRELTVVFAEENRKKPTEMRERERGGGRCMELCLLELFCLSSNIDKFLTFSFVCRSSRFLDRRRTPPRYYSRSRSPPPRRGRSRSRSGGYYSPPLEDITQGFYVFMSKLN